MALFNQNTMPSQFSGYIKTMKFLLNAMFLHIQYVQNASHFTLNMRCNEKIININVQKLTGKKISARFEMLLIGIVAFLCCKGTVTF